MTEVASRKHELKCWSEFFHPVASGIKPFEVRLNDRDFQPGDTLRLMEYVPEHGYTGDECTVDVVSVWANLPGVQPGHVVMLINKR